MIGFLSEWLRKLILLVLLASFLDMFLPNSTMQRYARLVLGLFILLTLLSPVFHLLQVDPLLQQNPSQAYKFERYQDRELAEIYGEGERINLEQRKGILQLLAQRMGEEIKQDILETYDHEATVEVNLQWDQENEPVIDKILVYLRGQVHMKDNRESLQVTSTIQPITPIQIEIGKEAAIPTTNVPASISPQEPWLDELSMYLQKNYGLKQKQVMIYVEKGRK